jgi:WD40 repeat protein
MPDTPSDRGALPEGAVCRLGSTRFRSGGFIEQLEFALANTAVATLDDDLIRIWEVPGGNLLRVVQAPQALHALAVAPDGRTAAAGTLSAGRVYLFDLATGEQLRTFRAHREGISCVAFAPDGRLVTASGDDEMGDHTLRIWDLVHNKRRSLNWFVAVQALALAPNGQTLAFASGDSLRLWDPTRRRLHKWREEVGRQALGFSLDGAYLASGDLDGTVRLRDVETGELVWEEPSHEGVIHGVTFYPWDGLLGSAGEDRSLCVRDMATGQEMGGLDSLPEPANCLRASSDCRWLAWGGAGSRVHIWDVEGEREVDAGEGHTDSVMVVAFTPDGRVVTASRDGTGAIWDPTTGQRLLTLEGHTDILRDLAVAPGGGLLATAANDNTVRLWDAQSGQERWVLSGHEDQVAALAFAPDGKVLASGAADGFIRFWDPVSGKLVRKFHAHPDARIEHLAFSPDGQILVSDGQTYHKADDTLRFWDVATLKEVRRLAEPDYQTYMVQALFFTPDGTTLAWCCWNEGEVFLLNLRGGKAPRVLKGQESYIDSLASSPDGTLLASGGHDHTVRLWDWATGKLLHTVEGYEGKVGCLAFSADGRRLAAGCGDSTVLVWDVAALLGLSRDAPA